MSLTALTFIKDDAKKIGAFIKDAGTIYQKRDEYLQMAGAISFYHAQEHGDPVFIQRFYDVLSKGHKNMFRAWLGKLSKVEIDGSVSLWLGFKDDKFFVKSGTENMRKGVYTPDVLLADNNRWMKRAAKVDESAESKSEAQEFNEMLDKATKRVDAIRKLFLDANATIPATLSEAIKDVEKLLVGLHKA